MTLQVFSDIPDASVPLYLVTPFLYQVATHAVPIKDKSRPSGWGTVSQRYSGMACLEV